MTYHLETLQIAKIFRKERQNAHILSLSVWCLGRDSNSRVVGSRWKI